MEGFFIYVYTICLVPVYVTALAVAMYLATCKNVKCLKVTYCVAD